MRKAVAVARKEFRQVVRDRRTLLTLLFVPGFFLLLYGYALNFDIRHIRLAIEGSNRARVGRVLRDGTDMSDQEALLKAIVANPDDDTPRLMYADWLDEHLPDKGPSPAAGPSARAEYIRVQCRLAQLPRLRRLVESKLLADWSPQQISAWLMTTYADDPALHVSHVVT